jgi:hypothetical protein
MGTNFYYKIPLKKRDKEVLHKMIDELPGCGFYNLKEKLSEFEEGSVIHLGKRSCGWQFLWDYHNGRYYGSSLKSIKKYLNDRNGWIENEYGEKFTTEEFFNDEIVDCLYLDEKHCDAHQYYKTHPEEHCHYNINRHEFKSNDGLRFSYDEDFC